MLCVSIALQTTPGRHTTADRMERIGDQVEAALSLRERTV